MAGAGWLGRTCGQGLDGKREDSISNPSPVSLPPYFPLDIYSFQGRDNLHVYQIPFHFPLPGHQEDFISCLPCSQIPPCDPILPYRMYKPLPVLANKTIR